MPRHSECVTEPWLKSLRSSNTAKVVTGHPAGTSQQQWTGRAPRATQGPTTGEAPCGAKGSIADVISHRMHCIVCLPWRGSCPHGDSVSLRTGAIGEREASIEAESPPHHLPRSCYSSTSHPCVCEVGHTGALVVLWL